MPWSIPKTLSRRHRDDLVQSSKPGPLKTVWVIEVQNGEKSLVSAFVPHSVPPPILESP